MINKNNLLLLFVVFSIFIFSIYKILKTEEKLLIEYENINGTPVVINAPQNISGNLIIIAHGFAGSTSFMRSIAVSLASSGHIAVRFDFLGHGKNNFPFHGDVTSVNGPTQEFLLQLNSIIDTYKKKI